MKKIGVFVLFFSVVSISQGQNLITNAPTFKVGIYKTFEEFRHNEPSIALDYKVIPKKSRYGFFGSGGSIEVYKLDVDKKLGKSIGKVFGFSDGKNVYITAGSPELGPQTEFSKVEFIGRFCYFEAIDITRITTGSQTTSTKSLGQKLVDVENVKGISLDKYTLRELIADDKELLEEFNNDSQKSKKLKEYVIKYTERS